MVGVFFFFQAEDGIRDLVRSRGLGDVYKRQLDGDGESIPGNFIPWLARNWPNKVRDPGETWTETCLLYTSDAADERSSVDLGGRRIIKKKTDRTLRWR